VSPRFLLDHFDLLAEAPGGVARLRELVLHLAVRGKLVPQDPADEPASELLKRIAKERARLVKEGKIRAGKPLPPVGAEEVPFEVPEGWVWCRLQTLAWSQAGFAFSARSFNESKTGMPLIRIRDIDSSKTVTYYDGPYREEFVVRAGDLLISMDGNFRVATWTGPEALLNQRVSRLVFFGSESAKSYIGAALQERLMEFHGVKAYTTVQHLSGGQIESCAIPLPPLAEQHRIVARVDELMALLDRLEAARGERDTTRLAARDSALAALRDAADASEVAAAWRRLEARMDDLFRAPEDVPPLRQAILQLAVRGRLVAQDPAEEPAALALGTPLGDGLGDLEPFALPPNWLWTRMESCFDIGGGLQKSGKRMGQGTAVPYLRVANVQRGNLDLAEVKKFGVSPEELTRCCLQPGDLLVVEGNGSENEIGRCARWNGEIKICVHQNHLIRCRPRLTGVERYALTYLNSPDGTETMRRLAVTTIGLYNLSVGKIKNIPIPLPPLAEQQRIVARVDELMALCDRLESRLAAAREAQTALAAAAVHHLEV